MLKLSTRRGTTMSPGRVHQVHRTIRTALNEAVQRGHLARNPAEMAKTPPVNDYDVEPYTVDELQRLFVAAQQEPNGARWVLALALGLRQGEALGLEWGDVDWSRSVLTIKRSRTRPRYEHRCQPHCGHKYAGHCPNRVLSRPDFDTTKSRAGRRVVPLPEAVLDAATHTSLLRFTATWRVGSTCCSGPAQTAKETIEIWPDETKTSNAGAHLAAGPAFRLVSWRWRRDLNPRRVAPHALSRRAL